MSLRARMDDAMSSVPDATRTYNINVPTAPSVPRRDNIAALKNALIAGEDGSFRFRGFTLGATGLTQTGAASEDDWLDLGALLGALGQRMSLLIGDYLVAMDFGYGQSVEQLADLLGYEVTTLHQWKWVCKSVESSIRIELLTFGHYQLVAKLHPDDQRAWLQYAAQEKLSIRALRAEMKKLLQSGDNPTYPNDPRRADSPTADSAALDAVFAGVSGRDNGGYHGVDAHFAQLSLFSDDQWREFDRRNVRLKNAKEGTLRLTVQEAVADIDAQIESLYALRREVAGE